MARNRNRDPAELFAAARSGDRPALARLLSLLERGGDAARVVGRLAHPLAGGAATVGITGAPGAGKSTLTSALLGQVRAAGHRAAVLAVDPSSPFTGGAILGDRVRMGDHALDDGIFIRSMATRGHLGGLALATPEAVRLLDAVGYPWVVIETVGVGQVEVEVAGATDTRVVVVNPGWGDAVQANKAGLMEIADIFVINKADRPGAADTRRDLEQMLEMSSTSASAATPAAVAAGDSGRPSAGSPVGTWRPPIVDTVAVTGDGVDALWRAVDDHRKFLADSGELALRRRLRLTDELQQILVERLAERARALAGAPAFERAEADVVARRLDPYTAVDRLLDES